MQIFSLITMASCYRWTPSWTDPSNSLKLSVAIVRSTSSEFHLLIICSANKCSSIFNLMYINVLGCPNILELCVRHQFKSTVSGGTSNIPKLNGNKRQRAGWRNWQGNNCRCRSLALPQSTDLSGKSPLWQMDPSQKILTERPVVCPVQQHWMKQERLLIGIARSINPLASG